ncbi:MAG: DUF6036 family nucleotidyltransferase [Anaerolineales bacterium]|nr:DUF6036 family nucleotidyltransferase [Anaerolineales bacterium]
MGNGLATEEIRNFLNHLSQIYTQPVKLYLLGGSALCFLGSPRRTVDIDCVVDNSTKEFKDTVEAVANKLQVEVEIISIDEFIPLPPNNTERHQNVEKFGRIEVYIYDPYSIALSKLARGFDTDIQDVLFLLQNGIIKLDTLTKFVQNAIPLAWDYDIDPNELKTFLDVVRKLYQ